MRSLLARIPMPVRRRYIGDDPLETLIQTNDRFTPIRISARKTTSKIRTKILAERKAPEQFHIDNSLNLGVIIPVRDREEHLQQLLPVLTAAIESQSIEHQILVVEQAAGKMFNRAKIFNVGATLLSEWADYFCFHDVDNLPVQAEYGCGSQPLRLISHWSDTWRNYDLIEVGAFGGVTSMHTDHFRLINGFGNNYWGWGQEDDDFFVRCLLKGLVPYQDTEGTFSDLANPDSESQQRSKPVRNANKRVQRWEMALGQMGSNGLSDVDFRIVERSEQNSIRRVRVEI
jgi:hypothetical protein